MRLTRNILVISISISFWCIIAICCYAGQLDVGDGFFYNSQYEKAISAYSDAVVSEKEKSKQAKINYMIGLSYFLLGDMDNSVKYWMAAKEVNQGIFAGKIYRVPSAGMEPQLIIGDMIIVDNEYYKHKEIKRSDVVVFLNPEDTKNLLIKRVIGLPGDKIEVSKKQIFVNGIKFFDKAAKFTGKGYDPKRDDFGPITIPDGSLFLLGDNRDQSYDCRHFGPVKQDFIVGKALVIYGSTPNRDSIEGALLDRTGMIIN